MKSTMNWLTVWIIVFVDHLASAKAIPRVITESQQRALFKRGESNLQINHSLLERRAKSAKPMANQKAAVPKSAPVQKSIPAQKSVSAQMSRTGSSKANKPQTKSTGPAKASKSAKPNNGYNGKLNKRGGCFSSQAQSPRTNRSRSPTRANQGVEARSRSSSATFFGSVGSPARSWSQASDAIGTTENVHHPQAHAVASSSRPQNPQDHRIPSRGSGSNSEKSSNPRSAASSIEPNLTRPGRYETPPDPAVKAKVRGPGYLSINNGRTFRDNNKVRKGDVLKHSISGPDRAVAEVSAFHGGGGRRRVEGAGDLVEARVHKQSLGIAKIKISDQDGVRRHDVGKYANRGEHRFMAYSDDPMKPASIRVKSSGNVDTKITALRDPLRGVEPGAPASSTTSSSGASDDIARLQDVS